MTQSFTELMKPVEQFVYRPRHNYRYINATNEYIIERKFSDPKRWGTSLTVNQGKDSHNINLFSASVNLSNKHNITFEQIKSLYKEISTISGNTQKEVHRKTVNLFSKYPHLKIDHNLQRTLPLNEFSLNLQDNSFINSQYVIISKIPKNYFIKTDKFILASFRLKEQLNLLNIAIPEYFDSKPEIIRFLHTTVAENLSLLYYQEENHEYDKFWWKYFIRDGITLEQIFE